MFVAHFLKIVYDNWMLYGSLTNFMWTSFLFLVLFIFPLLLNIFQFGLHEFDAGSHVTKSVH